MGNPTTYKNEDLYWNYGRLLTRYGDNNFQYGADNIRYKKNDTVYTLDGSTILKETDGTKTITYYHGNGGVIGFNYNGADYYFEKNLQGDVIALLDKDGYLVAKYVYDAWGKILLMKDKNGNDISNNTSHIGYINPIRYRNYYYDVETNLYYLESRYYDPETGRFLNADSLSYLGEGSDLQNYNLYSYCENNPVMMTDETGHLPNWAKWLIGGVAFVGAVALTALSGGPLGPVFIGMGASIAMGGVVDGTWSALNGGSFWEGFMNGAADGAMWGGLFALGGAVVNFIKNFNLIRSRGVVIGKGMDRVDFMADQAALSKYRPMKGYKLIKGSGNIKWRVALADKLSIAHNKEWINRVMRLNKPIYDIGLGAIQDAGAWYGMELTQVANYAMHFLF